MQITKLGIDVGGTNTKFGLLNEDNQIIKKWSVESELTQILDFKNIVKKEIQNICKEYKVIEINISTTGVVDSKGLIIAGNIKEYIHFDWKQFIDTEFGEGIFKRSLNDANAFAMHQLRTTLKNDFICITIGTGVGLSIVSESKLKLGNDFIAGEIGSLMWKDNLNIDQYFSATALNRKISKIIKEEKFSFSDLGKHLENNEVKDLISDYTNELAKLISIIISLNNPPYIFIAGGISYSPQLLLDEVILKIKKHFPKHLKHSTKIIYAKDKNDSNILGLF